MGKTVRMWTALEFMQRCPDDRSGTTPTIYYTSMDDGTSLLEGDWQKLSESKQKEYEQTQAYDKCLKCPLLPWCKGDAKNQTSKSPMLKSVKEISAKVLSEGPDWTSAQLFNLKPSVEGIVFKEFDERLHVKSWNQMWRTLTGKDFPGTCDHDTFVRKCRQMKVPAYAGIDFGWTNPSTLVVAYIDSSDNIYVVRTDGVTYRSHPEWLHYVSQKYHQLYRPQLYMIDVADPGDLVEAKKVGLPVHCGVDKGNVSTGVQVIKKFLRAPQTIQPKLFLAEETTKPLVREFNLYHFKTMSDGSISDEFDTSDDHWIDSLRYIVQTLYGKSTATMDSAAMDIDLSSVIDAAGNLLKIPTGEEYAKILGLEINTEAPKEKLGKIGRLSELDDEKDELTPDGFLWTF
jgi:radical SAM protein with 4Fe4S-binding SPASM domain